MYLSASDHKAIAISSSRAAIITGHKDEETAKSAAVDACRRGTNQSAIPCELYAIGNVVVSKRGNPPMPPQPWFARNPSIETQFVVSDVPVTSATWRRIESGYAKGGKPKALAISADGSNANAYWNADNLEEAARRALEVCGITSGFPCMIVAIDDVFVVPIPKSRKVIGFFRPDVIASEFRDEAVRRLGVTTSGWNAIAVGAGGQPGLGLAAATEQAAVEGALAECGRNARDCRVIAIGPFLVESGSSPNAPVSPISTTAPSAPQ
jgi:adenylate cyclase